MTEAEKVVEVVTEYVKKYPNRSVGIVAFSKSQQELIEILLEERCMTDKTLSLRLSEMKKEPLFIKNLETVQGDERDSIIFSVGYGPDETGRLLMNFGPINQSGGERRLNVAFTRARDHIVLISSMKYTDIDLKRTKAKGSALLREYLDFAENGEQALLKDIKVNAVNEFDSPFETDVYNFLIENGYSVDTQVGCSSYKIDMCVKKPGTSDYVLAIECDGATYHSSMCARDRDRLRQSVLENMGWKFYRIWSTDWFYDNKVEKDKLLKAIENALEEPKQFDSNDFGTNAQDEIDFTNDFESKDEVIEFHFDQYELFDENKFLKPRRPYDDENLEQNQQIIWKNLTKVIRKEGPINKKWLLKRYTWMFNRQTVSKYVINSFDSIHNYYKDFESYPVIIEKDGYLFYEKVSFPDLRVNSVLNERDPKYIAPEELANGMIKIIELNSWLSKEGLYKELCTRIGRKCVTQALRKQFDISLDLLCMIINISDDGIISLVNQ